MKNTKLLLCIFLALSALANSVLAVENHTDNDKKKRTKNTRSKQRPVLNEPIYYLRNGAHFSIDQSQERIDKMDGLVDTFFQYFPEDKMNDKFMAIVFDSIDDRQIIIENLPTDNQQKMADLYDLDKITNILIDKITARQINERNYDQLFTTYAEIQDRKRGSSIGSYIDKHHNESMVELLFLVDPSLPEISNLMVWYSMNFPERAIRVLPDSWDKPYADTMVSILAPVYPTKILAYVQAGGTSKSVIKNNKTKTVQTLYDIATKSSSHNVYKNFVFYDAIKAGKMSIDSADRISNDKQHAFQNMVSYRLDNAFLSNKDEVLADIRLKGVQKYVRDMNELHDESDAVRFKCIANLSPEEMYYVAIAGSDEIYTSSFLGLYKRMMAKWGDQSASKLLDRVHYDKFRTFIRMASGYNVINDFLAHMTEDEKKKLIQDFVSDLEKNIKTTGLADAVDVADSYGSIKDTVVQDYIRELVRQEYNRTRKAQDRKGMAIYSILLNVFDGKNKLNSGENVLELPPVLEMPIANLKDNDGRISAVMFFYGDKDGLGSFNVFRNRLASDYKITNKKYWTEAVSKKNPKLTIYMNKPLPEPEDEKAQAEMMSHLHNNGIHPSVLVHRGHSYHVSLSIDQMEPSNRVVIMGSCGSYHNLKNILEKSKEAQIVSSKQTGVGVVNNRILEQFFATLASDKDIKWIPLWDQIRGTLKSSPAHLTYFEDYIPPYQNLGAIFVLSYYKLVGTLENSSTI